jgi:hypothetical protein
MFYCLLCSPNSMTMHCWRWSRFSVVMDKIVLFNTLIFRFKQAKYFLLCVHQQETVCIKLVTCNRFHVAGFLCVWPALDLREIHLSLTGFQNGRLSTCQGYMHGATIATNCLSRCLMSEADNLRYKYKADTPNINLQIILFISRKNSGFVNHVLLRTKQFDVPRMRSRG